MYRLTLFFILFSVFGFGQNIQFNDLDLLNYLTTVNCVDTDGDGTYDSTADFNSDGQIQISEAEQVLNFSFYTAATSNIEDIGGFENFTNIERLNISGLDVSHLDFSIFPSLKFLRLSSSIDSFVFDNPLLTHFELQNVGFNNPLFDLTKLPSLEYVRVQSSHLTDNLVFGIHNNLEELRILEGDYSMLNLSGMPALKRLTIDEFVGSSLDISNCVALEDFALKYTPTLSTITGSDASNVLERINFIYSDNTGSTSNLDVVFNNQSLKDLRIGAANSISISNMPGIGYISLGNIAESLDINNSTFAHIDGSLNAALWMNGLNANHFNLSEIDGLKLMFINHISIDEPLDLSTVEVERIQFAGGSLPELNLKNGHSLQQFISSYDTEIQFICVDSDELGIVEYGYGNTESPAVIHPYCTFVLGGEYYEVTGDLLVDLGNGCTTPNGAIFDVQFTVTDGESTDTFYTDNANSYSYTLPEGSHQLSAQLLDLDLWTVTPSSINLNFPVDGSTFVQNFCITPIGAFDDLEIMIVPVNDAQPGFEADYKLIYKNKGTTILSGVIDFSFDDDFMNFVTSLPSVSNQMVGNLSWNYDNLLPFEIREINFSMLLNTPTDTEFPLIGGDILNYTASITPVDSDETPNDNAFDLNQVVVNSFDPNDITCLQGNSITPEQVGKYVHYMVRFENTGTANAVNVVVKDVLDATKFDINSLVPLRSSHDFYTRIVNNNELEFIFEDIQLPFDDANNDGYVLFKIKTLPTLVLGDSFSNQAEIYFDFNFPIITNIETTIIEEKLSTNEYDNDEIVVFPNPSTDFLNFSEPLDNITIYNSGGKVVKTHKNSINKISIQSLPPGYYVISGFTKKVKKVKTKFLKR